MQNAGSWQPPSRGWCVKVPDGGGAARSAPSRPNPDVTVSEWNCWLLAAAGHRTGDAPAPALPPFMPWTSHYSRSMAADQLSGPSVGDKFWKNVRHCSKFPWIWRNARVQLSIWYVKFLGHFSESCLWRYRIKTKYTLIRETNIILVLGVGWMFDTTEIKDKSEDILSICDDWGPNQPFVYLSFSKAWPPINIIDILYLIV